MTEVVAKVVLPQFGQLGRGREIGEEERLPGLPGAADHAFADVDRVSAEKLSSAAGVTEACCRMSGGTSTSGGQPLETNAGASFVPTRSTI